MVTFELETTLTTLSANEGFGDEGAEEDDKSDGKETDLELDLDLDEDEAE